MTKLLGELEQKIMNIVWDAAKPVKPAEVRDALKGDLAYTTIMTVMKRLFDKGMLDRYKCGNYFCYFPKKKREDFVESGLGGFFRNILNSYGELAISQFVDTLKKNPEDLKSLREYLQHAEDK